MEERSAGTSPGDVSYLWHFGVIFSEAATSGLLFGANLSSGVAKLSLIIDL